MLIGFDLGSAKCGWCAGTGETAPLAGGFRLDPVTPETLGNLGAQFTDHVLKVHRQFPSATHWLSERPILKPTDVRWTLERLMGLSFLLLTLGTRLGKITKLIDSGESYRQFGVKPGDKDGMVLVAERIGIVLPPVKADGREDAADAAGVWSVGVRLFARPYLERLDRAVYGSRGGLL